MGLVLLCEMISDIKAQRFLQTQKPHWMAELLPALWHSDLTLQECSAIAPYVADLSNVKTPWMGNLVSLYTLNFAWDGKKKPNRSYLTLLPFCYHSPLIWCNKHHLFQLMIRYFA